MLFSKYLLESASKDVVVFYGGRFQPMHKGHHELYKSLVKKFGAKNVFIATKLSKDAEKKHEKGDFAKDPLTFNEKVQVITKMFGIPKEQIVETDPYRPNLELIGRDPKKTSVVLAFSEKDSERLVPGKVMQPYPKDETKLEPLWIGTEEAPASRMYYVTMPVNFSGMSATDFRNILTQHGVNADSKAAFKEFFGKNVDDKILSMLVKKLHKTFEGLQTINESMARYLGPGKYKNQVCYILDSDVNNRHAIQFLDGTQVRDVADNELKRIVSEDVKTTTVKNALARSSTEKIISKKGKKLGKGAYGKVYAIDKDMTTVVKISKLAFNLWSKDGYYNYLLAISKLQDNPFAPQIHEIVKVDDSHASSKRNKTPYLIANIEELVPLHKLSEEEKWTIVEKMVGKSLSTNVKMSKNFFKGHSLISAGLAIDSLIMQILYNESKNVLTRQDDKYKLDPDYEPYDVKKITNKQLLDVLKVIKDLEKKGFLEDLHSENIMARRTSTGYQLVISDPLAARIENDYDLGT